MEAMKDLRAFILIVVILAFVWLFTGGHCVRRQRVAGFK